MITVYVGGLGAGKSTAALESIKSNRSGTVKFGFGKESIETLIHLRCNAIKKHIEENNAYGIEHYHVTLKNLADEILEVRKPILLMDEWTSLFLYNIFLSEKDIVQNCERVFRAIRLNDSLRKVVVVCSSFHIYLPFSLYKKQALWNKEIFKEATVINKVDYGIVTNIKNIN